MKKLLPIAVIGLVVIVVLGYLGRHKIKALLGMSPAPATTETTQVAPTATGSAVPSNNIYMSKTDATKGTYMTDFQGMTLYTFDKDTAGVSNCTGGCLKIWPAYTSGAVAQGTFPANITVITRTDNGTKQFAWKGMPLYYFSSDTKAGDINGDGVGGTWHIIKL